MLTQSRLPGAAALASAIDAMRHDLDAGRGPMRALLATPLADEERLVAGAALLLMIGIADVDYAGFELAVGAVDATLPALPRIADADQRLVARAGSLVASWYHDGTDARLAPQAADLVRELRDDRLDVAVRCLAGMAAIACFDLCARLDDVLWVELELRPLLVDAAVAPRLADEAHYMLVQALYQCGAPARAVELRQRRSAGARAPLPAIELKLALLDAQLAIGDGRVDAGRAALARAEPLLHPRAPRLASWWHFLASRLALLEGRQHEALTHARVALRLGGEAHFPERWMGVTIMQEGQVLVAGGDYADAVPFFERAGRAASGVQADFCWGLAHFARALDHAAAQRSDAVRDELGAGLAIARRLRWTGFFRPSPRVAALVCALALEHRIEADFAREVIAARELEAVRPELAQWPWPIRITTLGRFRIETDGRELSFAGKVARKPLELLQFIIASGGSDVSAATVMFALWRDLEGDKAKSAFNVALHRLRKLLGHDDALLLEVGRLALNPKLVWVDCIAFEQLVDGVGLPSPAADAAARHAVVLYGGAFLHDTDDEAWQLVYRSRLASKWKRMVTRLVARSEPAAARVLLERAIEIDPPAEDLARELMRLLADAAEPAAAIGVYERCRRAMAGALGAEPSAATREFAARLRAAAR
jgi:DNA-binding SARP family transcriptional activator